MVAATGPAMIEERSIKTDACKRKAHATTSCEVCTVAGCASRSAFPRDAREAAAGAIARFGGRRQCAYDPAGPVTYDEHDVAEVHGLDHIVRHEDHRHAGMRGDGAAPPSAARGFVHPPRQRARPSAARPAAMRAPARCRRAAPCHPRAHAGRRCQSRSGPPSRFFRALSRLAARYTGGAQAERDVSGDRLPRKQCRPLETTAIRAPLPSGPGAILMVPLWRCGARRAIRSSSVLLPQPDGPPGRPTHRPGLSASIANACTGPLRLS